MTDTISIAIETSSRAGAVALGRGDKILQTRPLGPSGKHASELLPQIDAMLSAAELGPNDIGEIYISVGPGSFTGLRVGITVARTIGQMVPGAKIVAVPTPLAIAENFLAESCDQAQPWENLGVLLAAKRTGKGVSVHATLITRTSGGVAEVAETITASVDEILAKFPQPILLTGEGLGYVDIEQADGVTIAGSDDICYPRAEGVWNVGRRLAAAGKFTPFNELLPVYSRQPEAVRLWQQRNPEK